MALALAILAGVMTFLYFRSLVVMVPPGLCPINAGNYGVQPNTNGVVFQGCSGPCVFAAENLASAIQRCDADFNRCSSFAYHTGTMSYIDMSQPTHSEVGVDLYGRQVPINS